MIRTVLNRRAVASMTVYGSGLMGSGIAQVSAQAGIEVNLVDMNQELLDKAKVNIEKSVARVAKKKFQDSEEAKVFQTELFSRINYSTDFDNVEKADLVIEAIIENLKIKQDLFNRIDKIAPKTCIFTSNTSSLSIKEIASDVSTSRLQNFGGLHFFNPVPMMKLLEVVRIDTTSDITMEKMIDYGKKIGKTTVKCKDTPGFIVNRLLVPYIHEALMMYERGDASFEDIDTAMRLGAGYPMGPFTLMDYTGVDLHQYVTDTWRAGPMQKSKVIEKMIAEGRIGRKSGEGWYKY